MPASGIFLTSGLTQSRSLEREAAFNLVFHAKKERKAAMFFLSPTLRIFASLPSGRQVCVKSFYF